MTPGYGAAVEEASLAIELGLPVVISLPVNGAAIGGAVGSTASVAGTSLYAGSVKEQMTADAFSVAARRLSGLQERDSTREGVFLQALAQTANDPNRTANANDPNDTAACYWPAKVQVSGDPNDADADGNITESIPCFEYWWDRRVEQLKQPLTTLRADVDAFLTGPLAAFEAQAEAAYGGGGSRCGDGTCDSDENCGWANECPADCGACGSGETAE